jgi:hypothetical protein
MGAESYFPAWDNSPRRRAEPGKTMGSGVWLNVIGDYKPLVGDGLQTAIGVVGSAYGLKQRQRHLGRKTKKPKNREGKNRKNRGKTGKKPEKTGKTGDSNQLPAFLAHAHHARGENRENRGKPGTVTNYPLFLRTPTTLATFSTPRTEKPEKPGTVTNYPLFLRTPTTLATFSTPRLRQVEPHLRSEVPSRHLEWQNGSA